MMKKLLLSLLFVVIAMVTGHAIAENRIYIDDIALNPDQVGTSITVPVKASFDSYVSAWDIGFIFPEGMTPVKTGRYGVIPGPGTVVSYYYYSDWDDEWIEDSITAYPAFSFKGQSARFISFLSTNGYEYDPDYDPDEHDPLEPYGGVKWAPGDYLLFYLKVVVDDYFTGGSIDVVSTTTCGWDSRFGNITLIEDSTAYPTPVPYEDGDSIYYYYVWSGDINQDGSVSISDLTALIYYIMGDDDGWTTFELCDLNADGVVDLTDVIILDDYLLVGYEFNNGYRMVGYELQTNESAVDARVLVKGDLSGDGVLGISDVTLLIDALLDGQSPELGDLNGDGTVSIADVTALIDILLSNEPY